MPDTIETVESKWERHRHLRSNLCSKRQRAKRSDQRRRLEMPARHRGGEVRNTEDVEAAGQQEASDTVEAGGVPGYLWSVDAQVG